MKKLLIVAIALCSVLTFSCKKDYQQPHQLFIGATIKNVSWVAQPLTSYFANNDSLQIQGVNSTDYQTLSVKLRFTGVGNYTVTGQQAAFYVTIGHPDGPIELYKLDTTQTNTLTINQFNVQTNIASGTFQLHFKNPPTGSATGNNIDLTNGQFWMQMPAVPGQ